MSQTFNSANHLLGSSNQSLSLLDSSTPSLSSLLALQHEIELSAHVSIDDAIAKAYEEAHELSVAIRENNSAEIQKEARDVLINVLSVSSRCINLDSLCVNALGHETSKGNQDIHGLIACWGRETASIRGRYSRERISVEQYSKTTSQIVSFLLGLIGGSLEDTIKQSLHKFHSRVQAYLPAIDLKTYIGEHKDFPKPGILFRDISPLLANPEALRFACFEMAKHAKDADVIAGLDARGFIFGARVAEILGKPFVMVRKKGKLPGNTVGLDYSLEYGENSIEIQANSIGVGNKVAIVDDLLATGGTLAAASELVQKVGGRVEVLICLISLDDSFLASQPARKDLEAKYSVRSIVGYKSS